MKIPLKAFLIIRADSPYPNKADIYIGGVASSVASETAWEEDAIVVPLTGTYDTDELKSLIDDRLEALAQELKYYEQNKNSKHDIRRMGLIQERQSYWKSQKDMLLELEKNMDNFTNLRHFNLQEIVFLKVKLDQESLSKLKT